MHVSILYIIYLYLYLFYILACIKALKILDMLCQKMIYVIVLFYKKYRALKIKLLAFLGHNVLVKTYKFI